MRLRPRISGSNNNIENSSAQAESARPNVQQSIAAPNHGDQSGAPSAGIDPEEVEELAYYGLDVAAIALLVGCSPATLSDEFATTLARGRARQQKFLLEKLVDRVEANEWSALRFALKNACGMADNPEQAALQRHKLAQLRVQEAARDVGIEQVLPPIEQPRFVQSGQTTELAVANATSPPDQVKQPASVRPRYSREPKLGGPACVSRK